MLAIKWAGCLLSGAAGNRHFRPEAAAHGFPEADSGATAVLRDLPDRQYIQLVEGALSSLYGRVKIGAHIGCETESPPNGEHRVRTSAEPQ